MKSEISLLTTRAVAAEKKLSSTERHLNEANMDVHNMADTVRDRERSEGETLAELEQVKAKLQRMMVRVRSGTSHSSICRTIMT